VIVTRPALVRRSLFDYDEDVHSARMTRNICLIKLSTHPRVGLDNWVRTRNLDRRMIFYV
jgi:hypothetical protein